MSCCGEPLSRDEMEAVSGLVATNLSAFVKTLRDNAFLVGMTEGRDAAALMAAGYAERPSLLRQAFKHLFCARKAEWDRFDGLFDAFWLSKRVRNRARVAGSASSPNNPSLKSLQNAGSSGDDEATDQIPSGDEGSTEGDGMGRMEGASAIESLSSKDYRKLSDPAEVEQAHALAAALARVMRVRLARRDRIRHHGRRLDLRRTIHANIGHGGVPFDLRLRKRKTPPLRLVILLDASGSMSLYTGLFLRFIHGVLDEFREAEAFLFHTRLVHVSDAMKERDPARALDRLSMMAQGAGGGTRIGECLADFNRHHARRVLNSRSCVMIVSDGYETGDPDLLGEQMAELRRHCRRIAWLNPMIGWEGYAPEARGIKAALPHVDLHAPAHSLESLSALEPFLARL